MGLRRKKTFKVLLFHFLIVNCTHCFTVFQTKKLHRSWSSLSSEKADELSSKKRVVIIGGGWAGYSAAESLSKNNNVEILLLDASKRGGGGLAGGWDIVNNGKKRSMEMGIHGFWREYRNTFDMIKNRIHGVDIDDVLTPYLPSVLVSEYGKVATAPVFGEKEGVLPPPIDIALKANITIGSSLTPLDLLSGLTLLPYYINFLSNPNNSWKRYDTISAENLFLQKAKISLNLYKQLVLPLLHVLPMTTGWDVSASAALSCFHVFALQSYGAFDVRWCRGSITDKIFTPWEKQLKDRGVVVQNGKFVTCINPSQEKDYEIELSDSTTIQTNAILFAVGGPAMNRIIQQSSFLKQVIPNPEQYKKLRGVTCVSVRLFLKPNHKTITPSGATQLPTAWAEAMKESPVFVCGPNVLPGLMETGFCIYDLQRLQDYYTVQDDGTIEGSNAVVHVDYFRANSIANLKNDEIVQLTLRAISKAFTKSDGYDSSIIVEEAFVNRARDAVSQFHVSSALLSPPIQLNKNHNLFICGDWIERCNDDGENGHCSWSTEKSVVTGRQAAKALCKKWNLECFDEVIPVKEQGYGIEQIKNIAKSFRNIVP